MSDAMQQDPSQSAALPSHPYSQTNPIDLTGDDEDDAQFGTACDRKAKRTCSLSRSFNAALEGPPGFSQARFQPYHSGLSPAMSHSSLHPESRPPSTAIPSTVHQGPGVRQMESGPMAPPMQPIFTGPSTSSAFFSQARSQAGPSSSHALSSPPQDGPNPMYRPSPRLPPLAPGPPHQPPQSQDPSRQVIDLTSSPSPPPSARLQQPGQSQCSLPAELPPKTPVCIGQLTVTALVLYPIGYLQPTAGQPSQDADWAPIRMSYEHNAARPGNTETIHIRTPNITTPSGEVLPGENFAVVEQKVATLLGPMLGKGLIRLDGKVRRGQPNVRNSAIYDGIFVTGHATDVCL